MLAKGWKQQHSVTGSRATIVTSHSHQLAARLVRGDILGDATFLALHRHRDRYTCSSNRTSPTTCNLPFMLMRSLITLAGGVLQSRGIEGFKLKLSITNEVSNRTTPHVFVFSFHSTHAHCCLFRSLVLFGFNRRAMDIN